jgi:hypothetical protein
MDTLLENSDELSNEDTLLETRGESGHTARDSKLDVN